MASKRKREVTTIEDSSPQHSIVEAVVFRTRKTKRMGQRTKTIVAPVHYESAPNPPLVDLPPLVDIPTAEYSEVGEEFDPETLPVMVKKPRNGPSKSVSVSACFSGLRDLLIDIASRTRWKNGYHTERHIWTRCSGMKG